MSVTVLFLVIVAAIAGRWLSQQRLTAKPWLEEGALGEFPRGGALAFRPGKIALGVFLAVASCLFALLMSAYLMRMSAWDWRALPVPPLLWFDTVVLITSSGMLQWALVAARHDMASDVRTGLTLAGILALVFLIGQMLVWRQLVNAGYYLATNPANSFFYLLTGAHALHLAGGLVALAHTTARAWGGLPLERLRPHVELCALYWHFLAIAWLALFAILAGWATDFDVICRRLLS